MVEFTFLDLRKAREARKLTRWQLANMIGVSEDTLERWETGKQTPTPDDVGHIEDALDARCELLWSRWMYSNCESYRERNPAPVISELLAAVVSVRYELADVQALHDQLARDAIDGKIDDPALRAQANKEIDEARAALARLKARIGKG
jgi:transcriptional regulator with XRE-family HTH domain